jgi:hypothetical protein
MSVTFYGRTDDGTTVVALDLEDPAHLNLASGNARAFLLFLGLEPGEEPSGEVTLPEARRAVIRARATFHRHVGAFIREGSDTRRPGRCRVIASGIGPDYFAMRLDAFDSFLDVVAERGARSIWWA